MKDFDHRGRNGSSVQSLDRGLANVAQLAGNPAGVGVSELALHLDLPKRTTHCLLGAPVRSHFAVWDAAGRYRPEDQPLAIAGHEPAN